MIINQKFSSILNYYRPLLLRAIETNDLPATHHIINDYRQTINSTAQDQHEREEFSVSTLLHSELKFSPPLPIGVAGPVFCCNAFNLAPSEEMWNLLHNSINHSDFTSML